MNPNTSHRPKGQKPRSYVAPKGEGMGALNRGSQAERKVRNRLDRVAYKAGVVDASGNLKFLTRWTRAASKKKNTAHESARRKYGIDP